MKRKSLFEHTILFARQAMRLTPICFVFAILMPIPFPSQAALTRGPYLQLCTATNAVLRWRTDSAARGKVSFGTSPSILHRAANEVSATTEHELKIMGLQSDTQYYYAISDESGVLASGTNYFFSTASTGARPTRIWVIGDAGTATAEAGLVRDAYYAFSAGRRTDVWLMLGDNAYTATQAAIYDFFPSQLRNTCFWPAFGNHEPPDEWPSFTLPTEGQAGGVASHASTYYSFNYGNIHFIALDSESSDRSTNGPMLTWLERDLAAVDRDWIIAYWHHPPYSKGGLHDSDIDPQLIAMRQNALPILESHGVDLVLAGHTHAYERSFLLNGHYGSSTTLTPTMKLNSGSGRTNESGAYLKPFDPNKGTVYAVCGCAGRGGDLQPTRHPAMYFANGLMGSLVLDITGLRLDAVMVSPNGYINDYFTIIKSGSRPPNLQITRSANDVLVSWPDSDSFLQLQNSFNLASPALWTGSTNGSTAVNTQRTARIPISSTNQFFRLRKQY